MPCAYLSLKIRRTDHQPGHQLPGCFCLCIREPPCAIGRARLRRRRRNISVFATSSGSPPNCADIHLHARHVVLRQLQREVHAAQQRRRVHPVAYSRFEYPVGSSLRYSGSPNCPPDWPSAQRIDTFASSARTALATISNGVFTLARYAPSDQNSGEFEHGLHDFADVAVRREERLAPSGPPALAADCR